MQTHMAVYMARAEKSLPGHKTMANVFNTKNPHEK